MKKNKSTRKPIQYDLDLYLILSVAVRQGEITVTKAAERLGVSRAKWYRITKEMEARHDA